MVLRCSMLLLAGKTSQGAPPFSSSHLCERTVWDDRVADGQGAEELLRDGGLRLVHPGARQQPARIAGSGDVASIGPGPLTPGSASAQAAGPRMGCS